VTHREQTENRQTERETDRETNYRGHSNPDGLPGITNLMKEFLHTNDILEYYNIIYQILRYDMIKMVYLNN